ncbi:GNAT family N-acetyltransferase [Cytobacillus purgationiresistens]|uniref:GNAT superfamily N-acetyltransferase n=1 Tax=Cytobacillus purgationiresistens TaxID=863449 RepID=A0ABU0AEQ6_9BACI|nr:GNAT family N-acetyltransferase [Cytobacillus purgationiresistens]MDQ0269740.1 GNAT superfamily N-acetyltransferase [Cytobacillus purgationiresistens]
MEIKSLDGFSDTKIVSVWNEAYEDYAVPVRMTAESFFKRMKMLKIDNVCSFIAVDNDKPVGICLHGISLETKTAWCGGMAILPEHRGKGIAKELMQSSFLALRKHNINTVYLEVLADNTTAYALYRNLGYQMITPLYYLSGKLVEEGESSLTLEQVVDNPFFEDEKTPWQAKEAHLANYEQLILKNQNVVIGHLIVQKANEGIIIRQFQLSKELDDYLLTQFLISARKYFGEVELKWNDFYLAPELLEQKSFNLNITQYHLKKEL